MQAGRDAVLGVPDLAQKIWDAEDGVPTGMGFFCGNPEGRYSRTQ
jgi:hypothetical protein